VVETEVVDAPQLSEVVDCVDVDVLDDVEIETLELDSNAGGCKSMTPGDLNPWRYALFWIVKSNWHNVIW